MARIRTIKPEFFRHEGLQDLERNHPGRYPMLVFSGLWLVADKLGHFEWKPRSLKLDILPFLDFDMEKTLELLRSFSYLRKYEDCGKLYGEVANFARHQRISGKEATAEPRYPEPLEYLEGDSPRSNREATGKHPGYQEKEWSIGKGKEQRESPIHGKKSVLSINPSVTPEVAEHSDCPAGVVEGEVPIEAYQAHIDSLVGNEERDHPADELLEHLGGQTPDFDDLTELDGQIGRTEYAEGQSSQSTSGEARIRI